MSSLARIDLVIVGAGPAGMAAARRAVAGGLSVTVLDAQLQPGGQIWRGVSRNAGGPLMRILGSEYQRGLGVVEAFLACGVRFIPGAQVSRVSPGWTVEYVLDGAVRTIDARFLLLATGAQERPVPFAGWTLPGVMTVGAGQILLKSSGQLPKGPVVVAGNGPLPLLFQQQLRSAGATPLAFLDTTPRGFFGRAVYGLGAAARAPKQLLKGLRWLPAFSRVSYFGGIKSIEAQGRSRLESVRYDDGVGRAGQIEAATLLIHEGLVPGHHLAVSAGAQLAWDDDQSAFHLLRDRWMRGGPDGLYLAGDGVRIGGAVNAEMEGEIAALGVLSDADALTPQQAEAAAASLRRGLAQQRAFRRFLDLLYPPNLAVAAQADETIICRCEELQAGELRDAARRGACQGPNQLKAFTRAGMGPCQGRQCGYPVHELVKSLVGIPPAQVGLFNPRPPFVPITVAMLAALPVEATPAEASHD